MNDLIKITGTIRGIKYIRSFITFVDFNYTKNFKSMLNRKKDIHFLKNFSLKIKNINYEKVTKFSRDYVAYKDYHHSPYRVKSFRACGINKRIYNFK